MADSGTLDLICPGLFGPLPALPPPLPETPALDRLLARGERSVLTAPDDPQASLLRAAGLLIEPGRDLPTASLCLLAEAPDVAPEGYWLHADPVHLRADRDQLLLFTGLRIAPDRAETDALVALFNRHFADDGLLLLAPTPARWFLRTEQTPDLRTQSLARVLGRSIGAALPTGAAARHWMRILNEAQMLFFNSEVNRARERQGRPFINGIWIWGGGHLPTVAGGFPDLIIGDHPLTQGLARWAGRSHCTLENWDGKAPRSGRTLLYWDALWTSLQERDLTAWAASLAQLESRLAGIESQLRQGRLSEIGLDSCQDACFRLSRSGLRRVWRRQGLRHCQAQCADGLRVLAHDREGVIPVRQSRTKP